MRGSRSVWAGMALVGAAFLGCHGSTVSPAVSPTRGPASAATQERPIDVREFDALLTAAWARAGISPANPADDATFLRRTTIDVIGTIPSPDEVIAFEADPSPEKRKKLVARLVRSDAYAVHWMNYWDDVLMGRDVKAADIDRVAWRRWLYDAFHENRPWNRVVSSLVSARGRNSAGGPRGKAMGPMPLAEDGSAVAPPPEPEGVNGAANYILRFRDAPLDLAGTSSRVFLGVQIQCAQCHDHKSEAWKQSDFRAFASSFLHFQLASQGKGAKGEITPVDLRDSQRVFPRMAKNPEFTEVTKAPPRALDGTDFSQRPEVGAALASWMTAKENPWFAKAIVNRMWGHFMGRGFVDPVDDLRASNPPVLPELLDALARDFVDHDYDLRRLVETICATHAYHLSAVGPARSEAESHLFAKFRLTPLGPEELLNALFSATGVNAAARDAGVKNVDQLRIQIARSYAFLFDVDEEFDTRDFEGTVTQALTLMNGNLTGYGSRAIPGATLEAILAMPGEDSAKVDALYLRFLSRHPTVQESSQALAMVASASDAPSPSTVSTVAAPVKKKGGGAFSKLAAKGQAASPRVRALEDLTWALLNSSEFLFNH